MFDEIADAVAEAEGGIQEISDATDDQAASSEEVVAMVDQVSDVSSETAAEATDVSAATEEQSASRSEASESIRHLSRLAEELDDQVSDFEVRDGAADAVGTPGAAQGQASESGATEGVAAAAADGGVDVNSD